jgi:hypothetical protein
MSDRKQAKGMWRENVGSWRPWNLRLLRRVAERFCTPCTHARTAEANLVVGTDLGMDLEFLYPRGSRMESSFPEAEIVLEISGLAVCHFRNKHTRSFASIEVGKRHAYCRLQVRTTVLRTKRRLPVADCSSYRKHLVLLLVWPACYLLLLLFFPCNSPCLSPSYLFCLAGTVLGSSTCSWSCIVYPCRHSSGRRLVRARK